MPTSNTRNASTNKKHIKSPKQTKALRVSSCERLNTSSKNFNLSRKRVEFLKKTSSLKRFRKFEESIDNGWITSGTLGSRDAVLVFRTDTLNQRSRSMGGKKITLSPFPSTASSQTALSKVEKRNFNSSNSCVKLPKQSQKNKLDSCIDNKSIKKNMQHSQANDKNCCPNVISRPLLSINDNQSQIIKKKSFKNEPFYSKSHLNLSFSSSDNSISSDCDDCQQSEHTSENSNITNDCNEDIDCKVYSSVYEKDVAELDKMKEKFDEDTDQESNADYSDSAFAPNMPGAVFKIKYKFLQTETKLLRKIFTRHGLIEVEGDENFAILWTGVHLKPDILRNLSPYQRVNHFPRSYELTRKDRLYKNIERMQHLRGLKHFDIVPQSFVLPLEFRDLVSAHNKCRGPWIVKPAASSRGRGIFIVNSPDQIPQDEQVLVSKYIADPLCIDGHKCDLRVYVLVTSFDPLIIYIFEEGLVRLATVKYDRSAENLWNPCMHLCNYSINKYHSDYIKSRDAHDEDVGHKWTLSALLRHLKSQGCDTSQLMVNIEDLIIKSFLACAQSVISACRMFVPNGNNCFELYGFDILIDYTLKPWLLEINLSPSMGVDSPLDARVKACLIVDLLTCIGIPAYSPEMRSHYDSKWTRFRSVNIPRRTNSADHNASNNSNQKRSGDHGSSFSQLTLEEKRIIRNARLQNLRRGGFVRIFPTEDSMQRYGTYLDSVTGIPLSTPSIQGQLFYSMILSHNYNQMLFNNLYGKDSRDNGAQEGNSLTERMSRYQRALENASTITFKEKHLEMKCVEESIRLGKQILNMINNGSELTQLQARQTFSLYLQAILQRLTEDPKEYHEKFILKFLSRLGGTIKTPLFCRNPDNLRVINKARSAMVAKLLSDFLEQYNRDTEAYVDAFDHFGMIPSSLYHKFLSQAQEPDLAAVLSLHTNLTSTMPYLYNRCGLSVPATPPIPSGVHGFLKALPAMVVGGSRDRDFNKCDGYYKNYERDITKSKNDVVSRKQKTTRR